MNQPMKHDSRVCNCSHHKVVPGAIIFMGLSIFVAGLGLIGYLSLEMIVGILLVVIGGTKLNGALCTCCHNDKNMK